MNKKMFDGSYAQGMTVPETEKVQPLSESGPRHYEGQIEPAADTVFVFGSNPEGRHGAGAAKEAVDHFGAKYWQGRGLQGGAYGLVTKNLKANFVEPGTKIKYDVAGDRSVSPEQITANIVEMYKVAQANPGKKFKIAFRNTVSKSLNGYTGFEMIDMFKNAGIAPNNVYFSKEWVDTGLLTVKEEASVDVQPEVPTPAKAAPVTEPTVLEYRDDLGVTEEEWNSYSEEKKQNIIDCK